MKKVTNTSRKPNFEWLGGGNPNAIENQEAEGQKELVEVSFEGVQQLPAKGNMCDAKEIYKLLGFEIIDSSKGDNLFLDVKVIKRWRVEPTDHSMWSRLVDAEGNERASIFL